MIVRHESNIQRVGTFEEYEFQVKAQNLGKLFHLLRSQLYSDKLGAILREYSTNACDAHTEIDQTKDFEVRLPTALNPTLRIRDFGPGLSLEGLTEHYISMGDSSKTESDLLNGCMGIGCKSAFSYTDTFEIISRHENTRIHAMAYIDESLVGRLSILSKENLPADEPHGLEVIIPIHQEDWEDLGEKAERTFSAFSKPPKVFSGAEEIKIRSFVPKAKIEVRGTTSKVYMGNVRYPLDPAKAGIKLPENLHLTFSLPIGTVSFAASREALEYNQRTNMALRAIYEEYLETARKTVAGIFSKVKTPWEAHVLVNRILSKNKNKRSRKNQEIHMALWTLSRLRELTFDGEYIPTNNDLIGNCCLVWDKRRSTTPENPFASGWTNHPVHKLAPRKTWVMFASRKGQKHRTLLSNTKTQIQKRDIWAKPMLDRAQRENVEVIIIPTRNKSWKFDFSEKTDAQSRNLLTSAGFGPLSCIGLVEVFTPPPKPVVHKPFDPMKPPRPGHPHLYLACRLKGDGMLVHIHPKTKVETKLHWDRASRRGAPLAFWKNVYYQGEKAKLHLAGFAQEKAEWRSNNANTNGTSFEDTVGKGAILVQLRSGENNRKNYKACRREGIIDHEVALDKVLPRNAVFSDQTLRSLLKQAELINGKIKPLGKLYLVPENHRVKQWTTTKSRRRESDMHTKIRKEFPLLDALRLDSVSPIALLHYLNNTKPKRDPKVAKNGAKK